MFVSKEICGSGDQRFLLAFLSAFLLAWHRFAAVLSAILALWYFDFGLQLHTSYSCNDMFGVSLRFVKHMSLGHLSSQHSRIKCNWCTRVQHLGPRPSVAGTCVMCSSVACANAQRLSLYGIDGTQTSSIHALYMHLAKMWPTKRQGGMRTEWRQNFHKICGHVVGFQIWSCNLLINQATLCNIVRQVSTTGGRRNRQLAYAF